jgi:hypothetical protein
MSNILLLKLGGIFHLICALFHIAFPRMFNWDENLSELSGEKKIIIKQNLHIMNLSLLLLWLIFAVVPFFFPSELLTTSIGKTILFSILVFWIIRIFVLQPILAGIKTKESWQQIIFFLVGFIFFIVPCLSII